MTAPVNTPPTTPPTELTLEERVINLEHKAESLYQKVFTDVEARLRVLEQHVVSIWDKVRADFKKVF